MAVEACYAWQRSIEITAPAAAFDQLQAFASTVRGLGGEVMQRRHFFAAGRNHRLGSYLGHMSVIGFDPLAVRRPSRYGSWM